MLHITGRNRLFVMALILAAAVFLGFYGGKIPYALFYVSLLIPMVSLVYILYVNLRIRFTQQVCSTTIIKKKPVPYELRICNESRQVFAGVQIQFSGENAKIVGIDERKKYRISGGEEIKVQGLLNCRYRGEYSVGIKKIGITDFWGLFTIYFPVQDLYSVTAFPQIREWTNTEFIGWEEDSKQSRMGAQAQEEPDVYVREYLAGDALHRIHWKASARQGKLMTRKYQQFEKKNLNIFMDMQPPEAKEQKAAIEDAVLEELLSVIGYSLKHYVSCRLLYEQQKLQERWIKNRENLTELQRWGAKAIFQAERSFGQMAAEERLLLRKDMRNLVITNRITEEDIRALTTLQKSAYQICVLFIAAKEHKDGDYKEDIAGLLRESGIPVHIVRIMEEAADGKA